MKEWIFMTITTTFILFAVLIGLYLVKTNSNIINLPDQPCTSDGECAEFGSKLYALKLSGKTIIWQNEEVTLQQARELYLLSGSPQPSEHAEIPDP